MSESQSSNLLVLGSNSEVARALVRFWAASEPVSITLASRDLVETEKTAKDLAVRFGTRVDCRPFDAMDCGSHRAFYDSLEVKPDVVVLAFGLLPDQGTAQASVATMKRVIDTNFTGAASILEIVAGDFEKRGRGSIIVLSSVAGERGRASNYIYGSAKAGLTAYLSGLRNRLYRRGVSVITILPGLIETKMTAGMAVPARLAASPERVAHDIYRAYCRRRDVVYSPSIWRMIMAIIKVIPEGLFKRLQIR